MANDPRRPSRPASGRLGLSVVGTIFFFVASLVLAYNAGRAHAAGARMATGDRGGSISPAAAFAIAAALFLMAVVYALRTRALVRKRRPR